MNVLRLKAPHHFHTKLPYRKPLLRQTEWWIQNGAIAKNRVLQLFYFKNLIWVRETSRFEMQVSGAKIPGIKCHVPGFRCQVHRLHVSSARSQAPGVRCQAPDFGCQVPGARDYQVPCQKAKKIHIKNILRLNGNHELVLHRNRNCKLTNTFSTCKNNPFLKRNPFSVTLHVAGPELWE